MDPGALVEGGADGLLAIVAALEQQGVAIRGAYLIKVTSVEGFEQTSFRIVTDSDSRDVIYKFIELRRQRKIPALADEVRISPIRPNHIEASRVLDYASRLGTPIVSINGVYWKGIFIQEAFVVKCPEHAVA